MKNLNRRGFIQGATVLAAGAAIGVPAYKGLKEYGPIDLRMYLFFKEPITSKVVIFSDYNKDLFGIRAFGHKVEMRMSLSEVKKLTDSRLVSRGVIATIEAEDGVIERMPVIIARSEGNFTFWVLDSESAHFWVKMADIQRVL